MKSPSFNESDLLLIFLRKEYKLEVTVYCLLIPYGEICFIKR